LHLLRFNSRVIIQSKQKKPPIQKHTKQVLKVKQIVMKSIGRMQQGKMALKTGKTSVMALLPAVD